MQVKSVKVEPALSVRIITVWPNQKLAAGTAVDVLLLELDYTACLCVLSIRTDSASSVVCPQYDNIYMGSF